MQVIVERVYPEPNATVWRAIGRDAETDQFVGFTGDWRPMRDIWEALDHGEEPVAEVPDWALTW